MVNVGVIAGDAAAGCPSRWRMMSAASFKSCGNVKCATILFGVALAVHWMTWFLLLICANPTPAGEAA
jgi:hypothetical protein